MGIAEKLRGWCTDWNGAAMVRGEPPRDGIHCDDLLDAIAEIERLQDAKRAALAIADERSKENVELRSALADAGHYVACCPPPPEATGDLRISLLEERARIAQAAHVADQ